MKKISVDGYPDLYRDSASGAIVNKNTNEYESYIHTHRTRNIEKQKINHIESDLTELKKEISEIKKLLSQLASN
jgi:hypothetical protein